jgi:phage repressor protein C with HTH and peptisase S24 domain
MKVKKLEVPDKTDFGIRIFGDSMEPDIKDGSIVWVEERIQIEDGQIGIFIVDGEALCKKLNIDHERRKVSLVSINKDYAPKILNGQNDIRTIGRVLL